LDKTFSDAYQMSGNTQEFSQIIIHSYVGLICVTDRNVHFLQPKLGNSKPLMAATVVELEVLWYSLLICG
jgi:hypothetical protein